MAVAELTRSVASAPDLADASEVDVRLDVHDASRLEWSVSVPLPEKRANRYSIDFQLEIPANVFARHAPWDQMQSWTRLDGPAETSLGNEVVTIDALRRGAVAFAHKLSRASEGFTRHCRLAAALFTVSPRKDLEHGLELWLEVARATATEARERLDAEHADDGPELTRERALVDEYISVRFLEMMAAAERALALLSASRHAQSYAEAVTHGEGILAEALAAEITHRHERGYLCADPKSSATLEQYLDRASRLKKHFQEVLFLESEIYHVAERIHHWVASFVAIIASSWAFAWQIALMNRQPTKGSQLGSGIVLVAVIAGLIYAGKDRIKEIGRNWISGNVHRFYAQRVAKWRAPARRLPDRDVIVHARESFDQSVARRPDPLNPASKATVAATLVHFVHKGRVLPQEQLSQAGVRRVKHIFRYDFSPLFARLDDAVKQVPVLDAVTRRVHFADAPRVYRVPVSIRVRCADESRDLDVTLVMNKRGLDRIERHDDDEI
jgi:hypothetical protein